MWLRGSRSRDRVSIIDQLDTQRALGGEMARVGISLGASGTLLGKESVSSRQDNQE